MKIKIVSFLLFFVVFFQFAFGQITITVEGIEKKQGKIFVAIYNSEKAFLQPDQAFQKSIFPLGEKTTKITIDNLNKGEYAITLFHDEDNNGDLTTLFGIPREPYGFSNNAKGGFTGPPSYSDAKFFYEGGVQEIAIMLNRLL